MAEMILGTGHQKSVRTVVAIIEKHLRAIEGLPRIIIAHSDGLEFEAQRPDFEGEFERFEIRVRAEGDTARSLQTIAGQLGALCALTERDGRHVVVCPKDGGADRTRVYEAVDKLCECLALPEIWRVEGRDYRSEPINVELLFQALMQYKASDVHLCPGEAPVFRIDAQIRHSEVMGALSAIQVEGLVKQLAPISRWDEFKERKQTSFNFHQGGMGYARVSAFLKSGAPHCTLRFLPEKVPSFEELNMPRTLIEELANLHRGLLLVTGMSGSGKTTTIAAIVDWINTHKSLHLLCIEDPAEYIYANKKSIISQRTLGLDVMSFEDAVEGALRHDPDVVVIAEMRDARTIRAALTAAATGHLVIGGLHSTTASEVVNRIVSFFDPIERDLLKLQLRDVMRCVICQRLVPKVGGGRVLALEMLFNDIKPLREAIFAGDTDNIRIGMQQAISHSFVFEEYLYRLVKDKVIDLERAREYATEPVMLDQLYMGTYSIPRLEHMKAARDASQRSHK